MMMLCDSFVYFASNSGAGDCSVGGCCRQDPYGGSIQLCGGMLWFVGGGVVKFCEHADDVTWHVDVDPAFFVVLV